MKHNKWDFQNEGVYQHVYIINKTQPSMSTVFNKTLDTNTHPLEPKTLKTLQFWWTLSKFRESKGYLLRQYEHGTYITTNTKAANLLFSRYVDIPQKTVQRQKQGGEWHTLLNVNVGLNSFQSNIGVQ